MSIRTDKSTIKLESRGDVDIFMDYVTGISIEQIHIDEEDAYPTHSRNLVIETDETTYIFTLVADTADHLALRVIEKV